MVDEREFNEYSKTCSEASSDRKFDRVNVKRLVIPDSENDALGWRLFWK
jgi:hypothetical protein